jgi:glycosyltransferase involved in cell wall biosynthesis
VSKNIWVINQFAGTDRSGWGERHFYFSKYWVRQGYNVTIVSGSYNHMFNKLPEAPNSYNLEEIEGIRFCWVKTPRYHAQSIMRFWSFIVFSIKVYFLPVKTYGRPDIIIVSSMPIFPIVTGYLLKLKFNSKRLYFEIRDIWPLTLQLLGNLARFHPAVLFIGWFEKFGYKKSDKIVSLLPNAEKHFEKIAGCGHKFVYIPNGLDENVLTKDVVPREFQNQIPKDKFIVGYTGTLGLANALEYFIEAAGLLKNDDRFFFVLVGDGYLKNELMNKSKDFGNIVFLPKILKNQVADILNHFDVCFVGRNDSPLFEHGVSANKYFDYMLASKPILDSNNFIKDPVELSSCGLIVKPNSALAIKDGILEFFNMGAQQRERLGKIGKEYVQKHHNIEFLAKKYVELFES